MVPIGLPRCVLDLFGSGKPIFVPDRGLPECRSYLVRSPTDGKRILLPQGLSIVGRLRRKEKVRNQRLYQARKHIRGAPHKMLKPKFGQRHATGLDSQIGYCPGSIGHEHTTLFGKTLGIPVRMGRRIGCRTAKIPILHTTPGAGQQQIKSRMGNLRGAIANGESFGDKSNRKLLRADGQIRRKWSRKAFLGRWFAQGRAID
mmetsp:Transcript_464/g.1084  ORF Transcript_464/g.1084 Transcript_464/m.1084 type:complete len:202 (+) Transcript_464:414-1019(+)